MSAIEMQKIDLRDEDDEDSSPARLGTDINNFFFGVTRRNAQSSPELCRIGLSLLRSPGARDVILDFFGSVFQDAIASCINQSQNDFDDKMSSNPSLEAVQIVGPHLCSMNKQWAEFLAPWCIILLKDIATNKSGYSNIELQTLEPVRILLEIVNYNLTLLDDEERSNCIDLLLASNQCEWVIGSVARIQPRLVISRALQPERGQDNAVGILQHLSVAHHHHARDVLMLLFQEALSEDCDGERQEEVLSYLINMATKSDVVLNVLTQDTEMIFNDDVINKLMRIMPMMQDSPFFDNINRMTVVNLFSRANSKCFFLLLQYAQKYQFFRMVLEYLLQKLEFDNLDPEIPSPLINSLTEDVHDVREMLLSGNQLKQYSVARVLIVICHAYSFEFVNTLSYLLVYSRSDSTLALWVRMLSCTISMHTPRAETVDGGVKSDVDIDNERSQKRIKDVLEAALRDAISADHDVKLCFVEDIVPKQVYTYLHYFCLNVITLLRWENSNKISHLRHKPISRACESIAYRISSALEEAVSSIRVTSPATMAGQEEGLDTAHSLALLLDRLDLGGTKVCPPSVETILKSVHATVNYFFKCLHVDDVFEKMQGTQTACRILRKLCLHSKLSRAIALRHLLETAMFREETVFGGTNPTGGTDGNWGESWGKEDYLLYINQKQGPLSQLTQSHTSMFHSGIIGKGAKGDRHSDLRTYPPAITTHTELLMGALMACMEGGGMVEGMTSVSLLLVELISPDVIYNGLPWPDEDFTKQVSIERELYMVKALQSCAVARAALLRAATHRPALCLTSALLRALAAAPKQSESGGPKGLSREKASMLELLEFMSLGQLLPYPLSHMQHLLPHLTSDEIVLVLRDCVWNYTRHHVPSPALFTCDASGFHWRDPATSKPSSMYTETLRIIIQKRISKLGHLYPIMFLHLDDEDDDEDEEDME